MRNIGAIFFAKECNCEGTILRGDRVESSGQLDVDPGFRKRVFWFANERPRLVFNSEVWEWRAVVSAYNATDGFKHFIVGTRGL